MPVGNLVKLTQDRFLECPSFTQGQTDFSNCLLPGISWIPPKQTFYLRKTVVQGGVLCPFVNFALLYESKIICEVLMFTSTVRVLMDKKKKTVRAIKDETGLSFATIQRAVSDETIHKCELGTLGRIADALGVKAKRLFDEVEKESGKG